MKNFNENFKKFIIFLDLPKYELLIELGFIFGISTSSSAITASLTFFFFLLGIFDPTGITSILCSRISEACILLGRLVVSIVVCAQLDAKELDIELIESSLVRLERRTDERITETRFSETKSFSGLLRDWLSRMN